MSESRQADQIYTVREWEGARVLTLQINAKYLNYDVSDGLKVRLRDTVQQHLDRGVRHFVMDLSRVSIVDSCGVGLMIGIHNLVRDREASLYLTGITHFLAKIFRMMHLDQYFQVVETEDEVLELVSAAT